VIQIRRNQQGSRALVGPLVRRTTHLVRTTAPSIGARAVQFSGLAVLALVLPPAEYGRFVGLQAAVLGLASVIGSTTSASANTAAARLAAGHPSSVPGLVRAVVAPRTRLFLANGAVAAVLVPVAAASLQLVDGSAGWLPMIAVGALSGVLPVTENVLGAVAGGGRASLAASVDAGRAVVTVGGALGGAVVAGPVGALAVPLVLETTGIGLLAVLLRRRSPDVTPRPEGVVVTEGLRAGIAANVLGQVANWCVLWGVSTAAGAVGLGTYGVATRFASVVTIAPVVFGRTVLGHFAAPAGGRDHWTPRSYLVVLGGLSLLGALFSFAVLVVGFPGLLDAYPGVVPVTVLVLVGAILRALLIGVGNVCIGRRLWTTWVVADVAGLLVVGCGLLVVSVTHASVEGVAGVAALGFGAGLVVRLIGLRRSAPTRGAAA
jgi:hypothetical protein